MSIPAWQTGTAYVEGQQVTSEGVTYQCILGHTSGPTNEPDIASEAGWREKWKTVSANWGDYLFYRLPTWVQSLDAQNNNQLYRFLRIFGRAMNRSQVEIDAFPSLWDVDLVPQAYLESFGTTLGLLLPHAVDEAGQRRFLANIVSLYRRKGVPKAVEYVATRYLGVVVTVTDENWQTHRYTVDYDPAEVAAAGFTPETFKGELLRILHLYEPMGLLSSLEGDTALYGELNVLGDLNVDFSLGGN